MYLHFASNIGDLNIKSMMAIWQAAETFWKPEAFKSFKPPGVGDDS